MIHLEYKDKAAMLRGGYI